MSGRVIGTTEAARLLGVHPHTLRRWVEEGRIPAERPAGDRGRYRFARADLEEFMAEPYDVPAGGLSGEDIADIVTAARSVEVHMAGADNVDWPRVVAMLDAVLERHGAGRVKSSSD